MKRALAGSLALALALGCRDQQSLTSPKPHGISAEIMDGAHDGGNPHFFFLPPLVAQPTTSGVFNPNLGPVVQICTLTTAGQCDPSVAAINPGPVQLDAPEQYHVNWNTGATNASTTSTYRIQVFAANEVLGFADVQPVTNGSALKNLRTGDVIGLVDGRTLPIKFRIENGALCFGQLDCGEGAVGPAGGTIVTQNLMAGVLFPAGALSNTVTVLIAQITDQPCLPIDLVQREGCYNFVTNPPGVFLTNVTVAICVDVESLASLSNTEKSLLHLERLDFVEGQPVVTPLPNAGAGFLPCNATETFPIGLRGSGIDRWLALAKAGSERLVSLITPTKLYALHLGVGGETCCFSTIGWALPASMSLNAGDLQTAVSGTAVAIPPAVVLKDSAGGIVPGQKVVFSIGSGGGTVTPTTPVASDVETGIAGVTSWTLGPTDGANTLTAASKGTVGSAITFHATGVTITALVTEAAPSDATPTGLVAVPISPNLASAQATAGGGNLTLTVLLRAGTFDPATTHVIVDLDTDRNAATGSPGVDAAGSDAALFGTDYLVEMGSNSENGHATVYKFAGAPNSFTPIATVPATVLTAVDNTPQGLQATVPLALLGPSNGQMNFKVVVQVQDLSLVPVVGYTGIVDYLPNLTVPPGSLTLPSPIP